MKTEITRPEGLYLSEHYGTVECIRVVNIAEKNNESESIKLLNDLQYYQAVYKIVAQWHGMAHEELYEWLMNEVY